MAERRTRVKMDNQFVYLQLDQQEELKLTPVEARKLGEVLFQTACSVDQKNPIKKAKPKD